ncbi:hypothetical protein C1H46_042161 [Malus baccata]|uniref:Uncharacterized protein n=1 Tax=Malus baccata TaxID=106549 RepID=A0A540KDK0_MALBA|nr:hypothetical protein C1H46_042161 [Malus baccata]
MLQNNEILLVDVLLAMLPSSINPPWLQSSSEHQSAPNIFTDSLPQTQSASPVGSTSKSLIFLCLVQELQSKNSLL